MSQAERTGSISVFPSAQCVFSASPRNHLSLDPLTSHVLIVTTKHLLEISPNFEEVAARARCNSSTGSEGCALGQTASCKTLDTLQGAYPSGRSAATPTSTAAGLRFPSGISNPALLFPQQLSFAFYSRLVASLIYPCGRSDLCPRSTRCSGSCACSTRSSRPTKRSPATRVAHRPLAQQRRPWAPAQPLVPLLPPPAQQIPPREWPPPVRRQHAPVIRHHRRRQPWKRREPRR